MIFLLIRYKMIIFGVLALLSAIGAIHGKENVVACYYGTWAAYRPGLGNFAVDNVDPFLCTHLFYAFAGIDTEGTIISLDPYLELPENRDNFRKFNGLKKKNPRLKTVLAVGGWSQGSSKFSVMAASPALRKNFIDSGLQMLRDYGFDGLSIDWLYPNGRDTVHHRADIDNFTQLLKEIKEEFDKHGLILTAAVASHEQGASLSYDVPSIAK
ncbi:unnamed protein product [Diatraea saccharalis]|uniref:GH18 domain-containing protein n=1 Tax=Diatraea saccharalis TaxID=40085 RepID=A0A9N9R897_9NEOP|nr:unnamed protein product [Diatraea saccharalis]